MRLLPFGLVVGLLGCTPWWTTPAKLGVDLATTAAEERKIPEVERDFTVRANVINAFVNDAPALVIPVNVDVYQGQVMLTGAVADQQAAALAEQLAWQVEGVQRVFNDIEVIEEDQLQRVTRDTGTEYKIKARLVTALGVRSRNYRWRSVNDTVYLIGMAQSQEELEEVKELIDDLDEVHEIVSHVKIKPPDEPAAIPISGRGGSDPPIAP
jgi:osmotically-inducible protein OsmY